MALYTPFEQLCASKNWSLQAVLEQDTLYIRLLIKPTIFRVQIYEGSICMQNRNMGIFNEECITLPELKQYIRNPNNIQLNLKKQVLKVVRAGMIIKDKLITVLEIPIKFKSVQQKEPEQLVIESVISRTQKREGLDQEEIKQSFVILSSCIVALLRERQQSKANQGRVGKRLEQLSNNLIENAENTKILQVETVRKIQEIQQRSEEAIEKLRQEMKYKIQQSEKSIICILNPKIEELKSKIEKQQKMSTYLQNQIAQTRSKLMQIITEHTNSVQQKISDFEISSKEKIQQTEDKMLRLQQEFRRICIQQAKKVMEDMKKQEKEVEIQEKVFPNIKVEEGGDSAVLEQGTIANSDGSLYTGTLRNGQKDGKGVQKYKNGDSYQGEFKENKYHGKGTYNYANGRKFEGLWENGIKQSGVIIQKNGVKGICTYKPNGEATVQWPSGDKYVGQLRDDVREGRGTYYWGDGPFKGDRYQGEWKNGKKEGHGTYYWADGDRYQGEWKNDKQDGNGTYYWADGRRYQGEWKNGNKEGNGTYYWADGRKQEGEWKDGKEHGKAIFYSAKGVKQERLYQNGVKKSSKKI